MNKGELIIYKSDDQSKSLEVRIEEDTVWLNRNQMAVLFGRDVKTIGKHINNALAEELKGVSTVAKFATVQTEGMRKVEREIEYYNLDVIISVGYRVKSRQGILFRIWANKVLKDYLLKGHVINYRIGNLEKKVLEHDRQIESLVINALPPKEGIFYDGQIYDAYQFVSDLIRSATKSIVLIDNYIDDNVLTLLAKRKQDVDVTIYTATVSRQLKLDLEKFNSQYPAVSVKIFTKAHDRFMIIDSIKVYHIGASLKDLGKKWFAFSKIDIDANEIIKKTGGNQ